MAIGFSLCAGARGAHEVGLARRYRFAQQRTLIRVAGGIQGVEVGTDELGDLARPARVLGQELHQRARLRAVLVAEHAGLGQRVAHAPAVVFQARQLVHSRHQVGGDVHVVPRAGFDGLAHLGHLRRGDHERPADVALVVVQAFGQPLQHRRVAVGPGQHGVSHARIAGR